MIIIPLTDDYLIGQSGKYVVRQFAEFDRLVDTPPGELTDSQVQLFVLCAEEIVKDPGDVAETVIHSRELRYLELCEELVKRLLAKYRNSEG